MALRFRKSIRLIPGVRLNFTTSGLSTTIGPRGMSVNLGSRGVHGNLGIPGTGLSVRTRLDRSTRRSEYGRLSREMQAQARDEARQAAATEVDRWERRVSHMGKVLRHRVRAPFDWDRYCTARPFVPTPFSEPARTFSEESVAKEVATAMPLGNWIIALLPVPFVPGFSKHPVALVAAGLWTVFILWRLIRIVQGRATQRANILRARTSEHHAAVDRLRRRHDVDEEARQKETEDRNAALERLRTAADRNDPEPLAHLLETELSNEDLSFPLVFEIGFSSVHDVVLELALPSFNVVPDERKALTKTGKVSIKPFAQRDRIALYADLCAGAALTLVHETYRVLPMVQTVEFFGTGEGAHPATGHPTEFVALHVHTTREPFAALNLDAVDATAALEGLGGTLAYNRTGQLLAIPGLVGIEAPADGTSNEDTAPTA